MERNIVFDTGEKFKLSPILPSEEPMVTSPKKLLSMPQVTPPVPSILVHDSLSQQCGEGQIQEIIESSPEQDFIDLQLSQKVTSDPSKPTPIRRSERIHLQGEKNVPSGPVTRSQTRKGTGNNTSILAYEINMGNS